MKIIQIGTNNGKDHVNRFAKYFEKELKFILLVEPLEELNIQILKNYDGIKNLFLENIAISNENGNSLFYVNPSVNTHSSLDKNHLLNCNHKEELIQPRVVKSKTIDSLFEKYKIKELNCLFIDTEGADIHIIKNINFAKYKIDYILFEHAHSKENIETYKDLLKLFGYTILKLDKSNSILIRNKNYENDIIFKTILNVLKIPQNKFIKSEYKNEKIKCKPLILMSHLKFNVK